MSPSDIDSIFHVQNSNSESRFGIEHVGPATSVQPRKKRACRAAPCYAVPRRATPSTNRAAPLHAAPRDGALGLPRGASERARSGRRLFSCHESLGGRTGPARGRGVSEAAGHSAGGAFSRVALRSRPLHPATPAPRLPSAERRHNDRPPARARQRQAASPPAFTAATARQRRGQWRHAAKLAAAPSC